MSDSGSTEPVIVQRFNGLDRGSVEQRDDGRLVRVGCATRSYELSSLLRRALDRGGELIASNVRGHAEGGRRRSVSPCGGAKRNCGDATWVHDFFYLGCGSRGRTRTRRKGVNDAFDEMARGEAPQRS